MVIQSFLLHRFGITWKTAVTDAIVSNLLLALAGFIILNNYRFYAPGTGNYAYRLVYILVLSALSLAAGFGIMRRLEVTDGQYYNFLQQSLPLRFIFSFLIITIVEVFSGMRHAMQEQEENKKRKTEAEVLWREAELSKLRQQLQPHFLFNSLNSISSLALSQPAEARRMIQQLGDFLRGTMKKDGQQLVPVKDELAHLQLYLDIEKIRFGHRLQTVTETDQEGRGCMMPSLLLQPVLENAIKFGLYGHTGEVTIRIMVQKRNGMLEISVQNPFDPAMNIAPPGTGFGLESVRRRLYLLFARRDLVTTGHDGNLYTTTLLIPQTT